MVVCAAVRFIAVLRRKDTTTAQLYRLELYPSRGAAAPAPAGTSSCAPHFALDNYLPSLLRDADPIALTGPSAELSGHDILTDSHATREVRHTTHAQARAALPSASNVSNESDPLIGEPDRRPHMQMQNVNPITLRAWQRRQVVSMANGWAETRRGAEASAQAELERAKCP